MTSFSRVGATGVNAHHGLMVNILRKEWGFKGLISTDYVVTGEFFNPEDCVANNVTFMACTNSDQNMNNFWGDYKSKTKKDPYLNEQLKNNMHYYMYAIANSSTLNGFDANTVAIDSASTVSWWQTALIAGGSTILALSVAVMGLYIFLSYRKPKEVE